MNVEVNSRRGAPQEREFYTPFLSGESVRIWVKTTFTERDVHAMLADLAAVRERVHKLIRARELAAFHKLEQMRRVQMLQKPAAQKRKVVSIGMR